MTPEQIVAMLSRQFADIETRQQRSFDFDLPGGRFEVLDLSHNLLLNGCSVTGSPDIKSMNF